MQGLQGYHGLDDDNLWQLAVGLGAGVGRCKATCGAVTGGAIVCGLVTARQRGSTREDRWGLRDDSYARVQQLVKRFEERFGSTNCFEMTGCDFRTPEGKAKFKDEKGMEQICRPAVRLVAESVMEICG